MQTFSPDQAGALIGRARKLHRAKRLSHTGYTLLDTMLWSCRRRGATTAVVSYSRLQTLAGMARATVASGIKQLRALGLLVVEKTRVRVRWKGGYAIRQGTNHYHFQPPSAEPIQMPEFKRRTAYRAKKLKEDAIEIREDVVSGQAALDRVRKAMEQRLAMRFGHG